MLIVDLLHKFELGVWKALFTHLIQILHAAALHSSLVAKLDRTYVSCTVSYQELINFSVTTNQVSGHANIWVKHTHNLVKDYTTKGKAGLHNALL